MKGCVKYSQMLHFGHIMIDLSTIWIQYPLHYFERPYIQPEWWIYHSENQTGFS